MPTQIHQAYKYALFFFLLSLSACQESLPDIPATFFQSTWQQDNSIDRPWAGADYWLNPLQAWRQRDGALQVVTPGGDRNCVLLTRSITDSLGGFQTSVQVRLLAGVSADEQPGNSDQSSTDGKTTGEVTDAGWVGFQIGLRGEFDDYRDDAVHGRGFCAGISNDGRLFIGELGSGVRLMGLTDSVYLQFGVDSIHGEQYTAVLTASLPDGESQSLSTDIHASWLPGLIALTCSQTWPKPPSLELARPAFVEVGELGKRSGGTLLAAFNNWTLEGDKVGAFPDRAYGPILWTQHTLSDDILKLSAQLAPLGNGPQEVRLLIDGEFVATASVDQDGRNALFRVSDWDSSRAHPYSVAYTSQSGEIHSYSGTIPADAVSEELKVASLSCVDDVGFPHQDIVQHVLDHKPDLYVFHGDQLYERVGGYGVERNSKLDYLRKWYIFGWSFRALMRNRPTVIIPDDHDVFHGNLWGEGGKRADVSEGYGYDAQDSGGYKEPPDFVNMVHRTQTSHLPDPVDPTPVKQGISVYFTNLNYRGVSFAILGDRQWKSAPKPLLPEAEIENGWPQNRRWNAKTQAFHPEAELLGPRQEAFLEEWIADWADSIYFKAVISQSPFCNVATLPSDIYHDKYVPGLPRYPPGGYPEDDRPVADFDANAWPQNKRDRAVATIRKAFALHLTGDQHLGSTGIYGVDAFGDAGYWISTPAVSNLWPRRWFPAAYGVDGPPEGTPRYTGKYEDGFGNKITVRAIANPYDLDREPEKVYDKAPGYAIITFRPDDRSIQLAVWPRWASPALEIDNAPYGGWPITIQQEENYGRERLGNLPAVVVSGEELIKVLEGVSDTLLYALRPMAGEFTPFVFDTTTTYTVEKWLAGQLLERWTEVQE